MTLHWGKNGNLLYSVCHPLSSPKGSCQNSITESTLDVDSSLIQQRLHLLNWLHHFSMELIHLPIYRKLFVLHRRRCFFAFSLHFMYTCLTAFPVVFIKGCMDVYAMFCHVISSSFYNHVLYKLYWMLTKKIIHQNILHVLKQEVRDTVLLEKEEIPENEAFLCRRGIRTEPYLLSSQENKSYKNSDLWPPLKRKANGNSTSLGTLLHIIT